MAWYRIAGNVLDAIANAINAKTGRTAPMTPVDMVSEIQSIQTGGGSEVLLASGTYTQVTDGAGSMTIPISVNGTALSAGVSASEPASGRAQTCDWYITKNLLGSYSSIFADGVFSCRSKNSSDAYTVSVPRGVTLSNSTINVQVVNSANPILRGTYNWYVWGYST